MGCESCGHPMASRYLYFGDGGYTFVVCDRCAADASSRGLSASPELVSPPTELWRERER